MVLLDHGVKEKGAVRGHSKLVPLPFPQVHRDTALVCKRLLDEEGALGEEGVVKGGHLVRGNSTIVIPDAVHTTRPASLRAGKHQPQRHQIAHIVQISVGARLDRGRSRLKRSI